MLLVILTACGGEYPQSTLHPTADFGSEIDRLFRTIVWWALGVFVVVETALIVAIIKFRDRPGAPAPKHVHGSTLLEISWTLAPAIILIFIAVPTIRTIFRTDAAPPENAMQVEVIGHQWWWEFRYPELGIVTANEMRVPAGQPVTLVMTSDDVIHSFWAPKLGGKRDVMPGRSTRITFTPDSVGVFFGQCAEFCGVSHANMRMRVVVEDSSGFAGWVTQERTAPAAEETLSSEEAAGLAVFRTKGCMACHAIEGMAAGVLGPNLSHVGSRTTIAAGILPNTAEGLARWIRNPAGEKPGSLMPQMPMTEEELAALVAYLQSLN
ncbi:MAG: cytochrome c oxidase subunit II [Gemmatimonadota bacterium]|nr:MAG: cytochrome c oxidase subunit II [Gemmatimonadota bacterium]